MHLVPRVLRCREFLHDVLVLCEDLRSCNIVTRESISRDALMKRNPNSGRLHCVDDRALR